MFFGKKARKQAMKTKCFVLFTIPGKDCVQAIEQELDKEEQKNLREEILKKGGQINQFNTDWQWYQGGLNISPRYPKS